MRVTIFSDAAFIAFSARSVSAQVELTIPEAGRVTTTAKVENGILGISNSFTRSRGTARECVGACFCATAPKPGFGYAAIPNAILIVQDENQLADAERLSRER
jgi:hypothetical protein